METLKKILVSLAGIIIALSIVIELTTGRLIPAMQNLYYKLSHTEETTATTQDWLKNQREK